jgi:hypothetical protein
MSAPVSAVSGCQRELPLRELAGRFCGVEVVLPFPNHHQANDPAITNSIMKNASINRTANRIALRASARNNTTPTRLTAMMMGMMGSESIKKQETEDRREKTEVENQKLESITAD